MKKHPFSAGSDATRDELSGQPPLSPEFREHLDQLQRFRTLLDHANDIILLVRLDSLQIVDANSSACRQLSYPGEMLIGMPVENVVDFESLQWPEGAAEEAERRTISTQLRRREGDRLPVEILLSMEEFGDTPYVVIVARDVTERLRAEAVLRKSEWEKGLILESTEELVVFHDREMRIVWANRAAAESVHLTSDQLKGRYCWELWHQRHSPCSNCPVVGSVRTGQPHSAEITTADGRVWLIRGYPVRNDEGEIEGVVELCLDITERKRAEETLRESDRMKTEFISTAAHELRTPLTSILGFSQVLLSSENLSDAEHKEFLQYIYQQATALAGMVADLLDIARIESGQGLTLKQVPCTAGELVIQLSPFLQSGPERTRFELSIAAETAPLRVDKAKMAEVFENLLSNAVKYSPPGSPIRIAGEIVGGSYRFSVADRGIGMTPEQVARVFDKFYRADASDTAVSGLGLGMSIVRNIVEAHGGRIWVESEPGRGTTAHFLLPLALPAAAGKGSKIEENSDR
ncbi:MAG TPA: PAS domain-containing sensor histidine kinase [Desulfuromonadales bacterium]|nr:PAS domain-containing sensor histidine kinase [Desulfuromonadales bacterium]